MKNYFDIIKNIIAFKEPKKIDTFVLKEDASEKKGIESKVSTNSTGNNTIGLEQRSNLKADDQEMVTEKKHSLGISKNLSENLEYIKQVYSIPVNSDVKLREFKVVVHNMSVDAFIVFIDGTINTQIINSSILQPLMLLANLNVLDEDKDIEKTIYTHLITHNQINTVTEFSDVIDEINFGAVAFL